MLTDEEIGEIDKDIMIEGPLALPGQTQPTDTSSGV